jgi:hypothetical protein
MRNRQGRQVRQEERTDGMATEETKKRRQFLSGSRQYPAPFPPLRVFVADSPLGALSFPLSPLYLSAGCYVREGWLH